MEQFNNELSKMTLEEVLERKASLEGEIRSATVDTDLEEMSAKVDLINARIAELKDLEERNQKAEELKNGASAETLEIRKETKTMDIKELRNSASYMDAYAEFIKTGKDEEVRKLMTENAVDGTIAVPELVYDAVKTAWDKNEITSLVTKANVKGNLKVQFEISGTDAVVHTEGGEAVTEETLTEGIATLTPAYIKKWISVTDEVMAMRGEAFLAYIYNELAYRIAKKIADQIVALIVALPASATATSPNANKITTAPAMATVANAIANLSDEASNPVIMMNKLTWGEFKRIQYANGYGADPFGGLKVVFNNTMPAYASADAGAVYMAVGDLGHGVIANFPNGEGIEFKFDDLSRKKEDLVEVLGKEYVGVGVVACKAFTLIAKPVTE